MPATATILKDSGSGTTRNVRVQWQDDDGVINAKMFRLPAGVDSQTWADSLAEKRSATARKKEMEAAISRCIDGEDPDTIEIVRIARPKLWEHMTRRLHNGPRRGLDKDTMRGLAQWVVNRANPAIRADLNNVRTNAEVNTLKAEWQALLDAGITEFPEVEEE
jgi:hypothetical protein